MKKLIAIIVFLVVMANLGWINQNIFLPMMRFLNDLINNLFF